MNFVPVARMYADHVHRYSTDRNFSGNSVDPDQILLHYAPSDLRQHAHGSRNFRKAGGGGGGSRSI